MYLPIHLQRRALASVAALKGISRAPERITSKVTFQNTSCPRRETARLHTGWWERFPWKLKDDEELPTENPDEMARLAKVAPSEEGQKQEVEKCLQEVRLSFWVFNIRR